MPSYSDSRFIFTEDWSRLQNEDGEDLTIEPPWEESASQGGTDVFSLVIGATVQANVGTRAIIHQTESEGDL